MQIERLDNMGKSLPALTSHLATRIPKERLKRCGEFCFTNLTDSDGRVSEIEEPVHTGKEDFPNKTDDPSTEGR